MVTVGNRFRELSELTRPHGFVAGYAYGSSGLNIFGEEQDGVFRFVRSLIVLGNPVPNLGDVADTHHGLYADQYDLVPVQTEVKFSLMQHYHEEQFINIGCGSEITIKNMAATIARIVGY